ncbi:MAG: alanine--glyoxylate aminotransferase family protein [Rhodospirillales bacterium]|jgi:(S)-ureidoglycine-glyoxylate aminotransferase|nr:alanine--glyoxylate aminotransferase family protein [Rhodospirillales bacterium]HJO72000.1 alanine--glyoxylate aminotransferase family protein [Rhodospirillales bacterium]
MPKLYDDLNPPPRILMGPGPVDADPRVLNAMSMPLLGQFDPHFTGYMNEVMDLYRQVFKTKNQWAILVDGTARSATEACLSSMIEPGDVVLVPIFGRFGHLMKEIAERAGGEVGIIETDWGTVFPQERIIAAIAEHRPKVVALVHGDTSTTMAQPMDAVGPACRDHGALLYVDATATLGGMDVDVDGWQIDAISAGLQKCMSGPPGSAPATFNERVVEVVERRKHVEEGIRPEGFEAGTGPTITSNYLDLPQLIGYWSTERLNHHTEATSMLYAARECARLALGEGLEARFERHRLTSRAMVAGLTAMGLELYGDLAHKMDNITGVVIPKGVGGHAVRAAMLDDFGIEIGTSFGPLHGRVWRIGTMGYTCRKENALKCLGALEATLLQQKFKLPAGAAVAEALSVYRETEG